MPAGKEFTLTPFSTPDISLRIHTASLSVSVMLLPQTEDCGMKAWSSAALTPADRNADASTAARIMSFVGGATSLVGGATTLLTTDEEATMEEEAEATMEEEAKEEAELRVGVTSTEVSTEVLPVTLTPLLLPAALHSTTSSCEQ